MAFSTFFDARAAFPPTTQPTAAPGTFAECNAIDTIRLCEPKLQTIDGRYVFFKPPTVKLSSDGGHATRRSK